MKALVLHGKHDLRLEEVPEPATPPGWVKLRVKEVGICGTDKAFFEGTYTPPKLPLIPGHEIVGEIVEVGEGVDRSLIGELVTSEINISCGKCWFCRNGMPTHCPHRKTLGISIDGGMAEYVITRADVIHSVKGLSLEEGAFVEPLAAVLEALVMEPLMPGSKVAVLGIGTIGLLALQVARLTGPELLVAISRPSSPKASIAKKLGAHDVLTFEEAIDVMKRETPEGLGFDYVFEATGSRKGLNMALKLVRPRGVIAAKSTHGAPVTFDYTSLVVKEVRLIGSRCGPFKPAIRLLREGLVKVKPLVTSKAPLEKGVEAFQKAFRRDEVKVHLIP